MIAMWVEEGRRTKRKGVREGVRVKERVREKLSLTMAGRGIEEVAGVGVGVG